jgi:transcription antitermination factor NusG
MKQRHDRDLMSAQHQLCFTGEELLGYRYGNIDPELRYQIFYHLNVEKCKRCRGLFRSLRKPGEEAVMAPKRGLEKAERLKYTPVPQIMPQRLKKGQIWTTTASPRNMHGEIVHNAPIGVPVLIIKPGNGENDLENIIRVIPIALDVEYSFDSYSLALNETSPLMFPILLEIFNERPMLAGNLVEYKGPVCDADMDRIEEAREVYQQEQIPQPGKEILEWMQKEIKCTEYLTFPVNEALWEEEIAEEGVEIFLEPYRKAADTTGVELEEITTHTLTERGDFSLFIIQKRDLVLLRFISDVIEPQDAEINGEKKDMVNMGSGIFEGVLGEVSTIPESLELKIVVKGEEFLFPIQFRRK